MCTCEQLTRRLERLERANRRSRFLLALAAVALMLVPLVSMAQVDLVPEVIRARSFEVVDGEGRALVHLFSTDGVGAIGTSDSQGNPLVVLVAEKIGDRTAGKLTVLDTDGSRLVRLGPTPAGAGTVVTYGSSGRMIAALDAEADHGVITAYDDDGSPLVELGPGSTGHGVVMAYTAEGEERALFGVNRAGHGTLVTSTGPGRIAVELGGQKNGGFIYVNNYAGSPVCTIDANPQGHGVIVVTDRQGNRKVVSVK